MTEAERDEQQTRRWHLDFRVSLGIIIALLGNIVVGVWKASELNSRLIAVEAWVIANGSTERRLSVIETKLDIIYRSLEQRRTEAASESDNPGGHP